MIPAQPGRREVKQRKGDGKWLVYSYDPFLSTAMQWKIIGVFKNEFQARTFAFPYKMRAAA